MNIDMKAIVIQIIITIAFTALQAKIAESLYAIYSPHLPFPLPEMTFYNFFALLVIIFSIKGENIDYTRDELKVIESSYARTAISALIYCLIWFTFYIAHYILY